MGGDLELKKREQWEAAEGICVQAGVLNRCDACGEVTTTGDIFQVATEAYKLGNYLLKNDASIREIFDGNSRLMTDTIKEVFDSAPDQCSHWASYERQMERDN